MPRRRTLLVAGGVVVLLAGVAGAAYAVLGPGRYDHALVRYGNAKSEPNRYVNLPEGRAQVAIGSPDSHRVVVQWRDPDGRGWTEPETVWRAGKRLTAIGSTVRYGGGTVAVRVRFTADVSDEDDGNDQMLGMVCRALRCAARWVPLASGPQVTPDGSTVLLGEDSRGVVLWTEGRGFRAPRWEGRPPSDFEARLTSEALLAPDGSLRVVSETSSGGTCRFELLVSGSRPTSLVRAAGARGTLSDRSLGFCGAYLDTISSDWVRVERGDPPGSAFWFVRRDDTWSTTSDDPSGQVVVRAGDGCCSTAVDPFVHWNQVSVASRDGARHFVMQTQFLGSETWEPPVVVAGSRSGYVCDVPGEDIVPVGRSGAFTTQICRRGGTVQEPRGLARLMIVSPDLRRWQSRVVPGDDEPRVDGDTVRVGRTTWSPSAGFGTR